MFFGCTTSNMFLYKTHFSIWLFFFPHYTVLFFIQYPPIDEIGKKLEVWRFEYDSSMEVKQNIDVLVLCAFQLSLPFRFLSGDFLLLNFIPHWVLWEEIFCSDILLFTIKTKAFSHNKVLRKSFIWLQILRDLLGFIICIVLDFSKVFFAYTLVFATILCIYCGL